MKKNLISLKYIKFYSAISLKKVVVLNDTVKEYIIDNKLRNILVLFTDDYIEAGMVGSSNYKNNKCYFLDGDFMNKFRDDFNENAEDLGLKTFFIKMNMALYLLRMIF